MDCAWAEHQVQTTVDFAPRNRLLTWFVGGLNFQIEHHLFPQICHIHYPAIAPLVQQTCRDFGLTYSTQKSLRAGIASHFRWLRQMGRPASLAEATLPGALRSSVGAT
jgi:linoleoyl-CoA desaturase